MANAKRASARGKHVRAKRKAKPHANSDTQPLPRWHGNRLLFSPALIADGKRRYETTAEPLESIAMDFSASRSTLRNIARHENWVRYVVPPRGLSRAAEIAAKAEALVAEALEAEALEAAAPPTALAWNMRERIDALRSAVDEQIAAVRALRANMKGVPHSADTAGRTSHTLANLIASLERLHRLEIGASQHNGQDAYADKFSDMPADLDELRLDLARRIAAFMESRPDDADAQDAAAASVGGAP